MERRGVFELVGAMAIGTIAGYYVGAKSLLGIQRDGPADSAAGPRSSADADGAGDEAGPTTTNGVFVDEFERERLDPLVAVAGSADDWAVEDGFDGRSLTGADVDTAVAYDPERYEWSGDRRITVAFESNVGYERRSALVDVYADGVRWQADCGVAADAFALRRDDRDRAAQRVDVDVTDDVEHELEIEIRGATVAFALDGERFLEHEHDEPLGAGTVGFSVRERTETSFDNVRIESL